METAHIATILLSCTLFWESASTDSNDSKDINLGVLIPWTREWVLGPYIGGGAVLGVEEVNRRGILPGNLSIVWSWKDDHCTAFQGVSTAVQLKEEFNNRLHAIVGSGCSVVCEPVSLLAAAWNIPFISFGCTSQSLSNKFEYPTFTRTVGTWLKLAPLFDKLVDAYGWTRVAVVTTTQAILQLTCEAIRTELKKNGKTVFFHSYQMVVDEKVDEEKLAQQKQVVRAVKEEARSCFYPNDVREWLLSMQDEGMLNGDYVVINIDADITKRINPERPEETLAAYQGHISANVKAPNGSEWLEFKRNVRHELKTNPTFANWRTLNETEPYQDELDHLELASDFSFKHYLQEAYHPLFSGTERSINALPSINMSL